MSNKGRANRNIANWPILCSQITTFEIEFCRMDISKEWIDQLNVWSAQLTFRIIATIIIVGLSFLIYGLISRYLNSRASNIPDPDHPLDLQTEYNPEQDIYLKRNIRNFLLFISTLFIGQIWLSKYFTQVGLVTEKLIGISPAVQGQLVRSVITIGFLVLLRRGAIKLLTKINQADIRKNYRTRNIITWVIFTLGVILVGRIWFQGLDSLATYFGLLSAGIAIALKEPIVNIAGWIFIMFRRPFELGDRIEIGGHGGDVIDINVFQFTINEIGNWVEADQSTGRIIHLPNSRIFTDAQANFTKGFDFIWNEIPILLTFESDWKLAKEILTKISSKYSEKTNKIAKRRLKKASEKYLIYYTQITPKVYTDVKDSGVLLTIRYLCRPPMRRDSKEQLWEQILDEFAKHKTIDFAYPTVRRYDNRYEGKDPIGGPELAD